MRDDPAKRQLECGCRPEDPWPPPTLPEAPPPPPPDPVRDSTLATPDYHLRGPQVEPAAAFWTLCNVPCVVPIAELVKRTDNPSDPCFFPDYPTQASVVADEIDELLELASLRDDPDAVAGNRPGRERRGISPFLQLRPQPLGALVNIDHDPVLSAVRAGRQPEPGALDIARGRHVNPAYPVIATGRELARYFENETPGLAHRLAADALLRQQDWSPPRQALVWAALDVSIYSALLAAWHYKWSAHVALPGVSARAGVSFRPRPWELDYRVGVLYNRMTDDSGAGDDGRRLVPTPSPGTPRHPAYPSGHSTYAGAASEILSYFFPDYTEEFDRLADNAGLARLWAGIHYRSDHVEGQKLGRCVARMVIEQLERSCICANDGCPPPDNCAPPATREDLERCARETRRCCEEKRRGNEGEQGHQHGHEHG
ncbi:MAG: vanadium-dependent haloperoxidase [Actinomycetota bacterium]|nr:vanadium-dependent haloperoxidase [Actinomycetota bacterium]